MAVIFCLGVFSPARAEDQPRMVYLRWIEAENVLRYEVVVEKMAENGRYRESLRESTPMSPTDFSLTFSLLPGTYRYAVIRYDLVNHPVGEPIWKPLIITASVLEGSETTEEEIVILDDEAQTPELTMDEEPAEGLALIDGQEREADTEGVPPAPRAGRLNTLGVSFGTAAKAPLFIGTVRGTYSPLRYSFLELGLDFGMGSTLNDVGYYSLYPFAHLALFLPLVSWAGWYAGAGGGYMFARYAFPEGAAPARTFALDFTTGFNVLNNIDISYTLRLGFVGDRGTGTGLNSKIAVGWTYRFK